MNSLRNLQELNNSRNNLILFLLSSFNSYEKTFFAPNPEEVELDFFFNSPLTFFFIFNDQWSITVKVSPYIIREENSKKKLHE